MKKVLLVALTLFLLVSCSDNVELTREEYNKLKGLPAPRSFTVDGRIYDVNTGSDGHEYYYVYIATSGYVGSNRDFHYPGCELCKRK